MRERESGAQTRGRGAGETGEAGEAVTYRLAVLLADGSDAVALRHLTEAMERHDVATILFSREGRRLVLSDGAACVPDAVLADRAAFPRDAVAIILSALAADGLSDDAHARAFVAEAYSAGEAIAHDIGAALLLDACGIDGDEFVLAVSDVGELLACLPHRCTTRMRSVTRSA